MKECTCAMHIINLSSAMVRGWEFKNCIPLVSSAVHCVTEILSVRNQYLHGIGCGENLCLLGGSASTWLVQVLPEDSSPPKLVRNQ